MIAKLGLVYRLQNGNEFFWNAVYFLESQLG